MVPERNILISAFPPCDPRDFGSRERCISGVADVGMSFRLGAPQLDAAGLSQRWLMAECGHRHALRVADAFALRGPVDSTGAPIVPMVVTCRIDGPLGWFRAGDAVVMETFSMPISRSDWRCTARLDRVSDRTRIDVELVSRFVTRDASRPCALVSAEISDIAGDPSLPAGVGQVIDAAPSVTPAPDTATVLDAVPVFARADFGQDGLFDFARYAELFDRADGAALPGDIAEMDMIRREMRFVAQPRRDDALDLRAWSARGVFGDMVCTAQARRQSDGALVATCETRWRRMRSRAHG